MEPWTAAPGPTAVAQAREVQHFRQRKPATRRITRCASTGGEDFDGEYAVGVPAAKSAVSGGSGAASAAYAAARLTTSPNRPRRLAGIAVRCQPSAATTASGALERRYEPISGSEARGCFAGQEETCALLGGSTPPEHRACLSTSSTASAKTDGLGRLTRPETAGDGDATCINKLSSINEAHELGRSTRPETMSLVSTTTACQGREGAHEY